MPIQENLKQYHIKISPTHLGTEDFKFKCPKHTKIKILGIRIHVVCDATVVSRYLHGYLEDSQDNTISNLFYSAGITASQTKYLNILDNWNEAGDFVQYNAGTLGIGTLLMYNEDELKIGLVSGVAGDTMNITIRFPVTIKPCYLEGFYHCY